MRETPKMAVIKGIMFPLRFGIPKMILQLEEREEVHGGTSISTFMSAMISSALVLKGFVGSIDHPTARYNG